MRTRTKTGSLLSTALAMVLSLTMAAGLCPTSALAAALEEDVALVELGEGGGEAPAEGAEDGAGIQPEEDGEDALVVQDQEAEGEAELLPQEEPLVLEEGTNAEPDEDAEDALHIVDVPYGTKAEIGETCADGNINNALDIVSGLTTDLADHVVEVSAAGTAETTLLLDSGVEVAFGKAEDIRDKERVILKILEENPGTVTYINVRMVETPTWRSI